MAVVIPQGVADDDSGCGPGVYTVTHDNAAVRRTIDLGSPIVGRLKKGESVLVLESVRCPSDGRIRGRISNPAGWMSLLEIQVGYRWATMAAPVGDERAQLIREVIDAESKLEGLQDHVERLRAEHRAHLQNFHERAARLEERFLSAQLEPVHKLPAPRGTGRHPAHGHLEGMAHYHHDLAHHRASQPDPTLPPGAEVAWERKLELNREQERFFAVYPPEPPKEKEESPKAAGHFVLSNAMMLPSPNYEGLDRLPHGIFPSTRPPRTAVGENFLDSRVPPAQVEEQYSYDYAGAWRYTAAGGCPLAVERVEMVEDAYRGNLAHPQAVWRQTLRPPPT